ncbi:hypothetical protein DKX38_011671 [Salix brachista]|uniref:Uncharacterized protein n=1 Tax=Salix brachista TaxID=2182728 RepID=A0A5N5LZA1_9ROSI|nr:hypothetical protein DKX38_011671 [Salix brachista]
MLLNSPDSLYERTLIDDTEKVNQSEERVLKLHELNGVVDQSSSPLKREIVNRVMDTAKHATKSGNLNEFSMVMLNNTLSLPLGLVLIFVFNEVDYLSRTPLLRLPTFWLVVTLGGFLGLAISFTSMWFLHQTGATTYRIIEDGCLKEVVANDDIIFHEQGYLVGEASPSTSTLDEFAIPFEDSLMMCQGYIML